MRKMSNDEARNVNGGWTIYQCNYCGWQIMVTKCWLLHIKNITQYWSKPRFCPNCALPGSWKAV